MSIYGLSKIRKQSFFYVQLPLYESNMLIIEILESVINSKLSVLFPNKQLLFYYMQHPFLGHKEQFESVPLSKRSQYIERMLAMPQEDGQCHIYKEEYPHDDYFTFQGRNLHYYYTSPHSKPKAVLFFFHGLNSHGGSSGYVGNTLAKLTETNVYAIDFLNFGKSIGCYKGYIESFQLLLLQAEAIVEHILDKFQQKPKVFLVGGSLGGTVAFHMTLRQPGKYNGVVFFAPGLREVKQSQYIMKKIGKLIAVFFPKLKLTPQNNDDATRYKISNVIESNKLNYNGRHIPGSVRVALNAIEDTQNRYGQFSTPYILFQSGVDKLVDVFAPLDLQKQCKSQDKTTIYMKHMWHSLFYEEQIKDVVDLAAVWLKDRL